MNLAKRTAAWFLVLVMVLGLVPQTVFAKETSEIAKLSITYHLKTEDGNMIAEPYYADMPKGSSYDVISPKIDNYVLKNPDQEKVSGILKDDTEIKVVYSYDTSNEVPYKINYIGVNNNGQETVLETVTEKAPVDTVISIPFKEFKGYDKRGGEDMKLIVTADGQAEKNVYYDRSDKTYIIFNTNGSYIEPIIAEEGEDISNEISKIEEPTRQGYEFAGWDKELPTTMPKEDYIINAKWSEGTSNYTVLYWFENADDENYTLGKNEEIRTAKTNSLVTATDADIANGNNNENVTSNDFYGFDYSHCDEVEVQPDGTSVLNVYYKREIWKINYMATSNLDDGVWKTIEGKYFSSNIYKFQVKYLSKSLKDNSDLLIHTSYLYHTDSHAYGLNLFPPTGFVWDNGYYQTALKESDVPNVAKRTNPQGTGSDGSAVFYDIYQYTDIHMERKISYRTYESRIYICRLVYKRRRALEL